jgi:hypothetical protein
VHHPRRTRTTGTDSGAALLPLLGTVLAVAGFVLLAVEVIRTLTGGVLGTIGLVLLWVGVGAIAVGLLLLVLAVAGSDEPRPATRPAAGAAEPAAPVPPPAPAVPAPATEAPPAVPEDAAEESGHA